MNPKQNTSALCVVVGEPLNWTRNVQTFIVQTSTVWVFSPAEAELTVDAS